MLHRDFLSCVEEVMAAETLFFGSSSMMTRFCRNKVKKNIMEENQNKWINKWMTEWMNE